MSIQSEIDRLNLAKNKINLSISQQGVTAPFSAKLDTYNTKINEILSVQSNCYYIKKGTIIYDENHTQLDAISDKSIVINYNTSSDDTDVNPYVQLNYLLSKRTNLSLGIYDLSRVNNTIPRKFFANGYGSGICGSFSGFESGTSGVENIVGTSANAFTDASLPSICNLPHLMKVGDSTFSNSGAQTLTIGSMNYAVSPLSSTSINCSTLTNLTIYINPTDLASFQANQPWGCTNESLTVTYMDASTGYPIGLSLYSLYDDDYINSITATYNDNSQRTISKMPLIKDGVTYYIYPMGQNVKSFVTNVGSNESKCCVLRNAYFENISTMIGEGTDVAKWRYTWESPFNTDISAIPDWFRSQLSQLVALTYCDVALYVDGNRQDDSNQIVYVGLTEGGAFNDGDQKTAILVMNGDTTQGAAGSSFTVSFLDMLSTNCGEVTFNANEGVYQDDGSGMTTYTGDVTLSMTVDPDIELQEYSDGSIIDILHINVMINQ